MTAPLTDSPTHRLTVTPEDDRLGKPSASSMDRLSRCPGSLAAQRDLSELPKPQVTKDGTAIHESLETGDDSELALTQKEIARKLRTLEEQAFVLWRSEIEDGQI